MTIKVGDYVKCIDNSNHPVYYAKTLVLNQVYKIDRVFGHSRGLLVYLEGISSVSWRLKRFVLVENVEIILPSIDYSQITKDIIGG